MRRTILTGALVVLVVASTEASAQDAVSILRGSLADTLAETAGDGPGRRSPTERLDPPVADELATLDEGQLDRAAGKPAPTGEAEVDDGEGNEASIRLRAGYDSNYDELVQPEGSRFVELTGEISVQKTIGDTDVFASGSATFLNFADLDLAERYGGEVAAGVRREIGEGVFLEAAVGAGIDAYDDPALIEPAAAIALQFLRPFAAVAVRASFDAEQTLMTRLQENQEDADEDDYQRFSVETTAVLMPDALFAPVLSARVSRVDFDKSATIEPIEIDEPAADAPDDVDDADETPIDAGDDDGGESDEAELGSDDSASGPSTAIAKTGEAGGETADTIIERDAMDTSFAAGLRFRPMEDLSITISGRANRRDFDQAGLRTYTSYAPDIALSWTLATDLDLTLSTTRIIDQPDEAGSLAQDVSSYAATFAYQPDLGFGFEAGAGFSQIREIGVVADSNETFAELTLRYKPWLNTSLEAGLTQNWTDDRTFDEDTDSTQVSGAIKATF